MLGPSAFRWFGRKKKQHYTNKKNFFCVIQECECSWIFGKRNFFGNMYFNSEILGGTNFGLFLGNAMICIRKQFFSVTTKQSKFAEKKPRKSQTRHFFCCKKSKENKTRPKLFAGCTFNLFNSGLLKELMCIDITANKNPGKTKKYR